MASPSSPRQPSGPEPSSVLCDSCKKSVLEPSQNTENVSYDERIRQVRKEWLLSPSMWPVGYIIGSPYSPFRVEQELPKRDWRNAFEDLLALESGGEMISLESRKQENTVAAKVNWGRAKSCIEKLIKYNAQDAHAYNLLQTAYNVSKSPGNQTDPSIMSWFDEKKKMAIEMVQRRVALAEAFKAREETRREWSASLRKDRGQWMASLITSGALTSWNSILEDSEEGVLIRLRAPEDSISFSEHELREHFEDGKPLEDGIPGPPMYEVSYRPSSVPVDDHQFVDDGSSPPPPPDQPTIVSRIPDRPCFRGQTTVAERTTLPDGKMVTKVVMKNYLTNGDFQEKVMVQEPGKVLQEVEEARALIQDRMLGFDTPVEEASLD